VGETISPAREMTLDPNLGNLALRDDEHGRPPRILDRQERDVRQIEEREWTFGEKCDVELPWTGRGRRATMGKMLRRSMWSLN